MLTRDQILEQVKGGRKAQAMDGRDYNRLAEFFPPDQWDDFEVTLMEGADAPTLRELNRDNVLALLAEDVAFGFEKALDQRGLSASMMHAVVKMWMWVLEDELYEQASGLYEQYGLPFLKAVAEKYNLPNEIGDDEGDEGKYEMEGG